LNDEVSTSKSRWTRPVLMRGFAALFSRRKAATLCAAHAGDE
jgi:hypothetical protein